MHHVVRHRAGGSAKTANGIRVFIVDDVVIHLNHLSVPRDHAGPAVTLIELIIRDPLTVGVERPEDAEPIDRITEQG